MKYRRFGAAMLMAVAAVAASGATSAVASADSCDSSVTVCQGLPSQPTVSSPDYAPSVSAPSNSTWYFNPSGGGTALHHH
jgi:hypothetical protein